MPEPGSGMPIGVHEADSSTMQDSIKLLCEDRQDDGAKALKIAWVQVLDLLDRTGSRSRSAR
jgi:hypothetical protein